MGSGSKTSKNVIVTGAKSSKRDIRNISFKDINDDYSWGKYGDFKVIMMKSNGYINATKICNDAMENGSKKPFKNWKTNANTDALMNEISSYTGIPADNELSVCVTTSSKNLTEIRGTYVHLLLLTPIAYWISPKFGAKISIWIEEWKKFSLDNTFNYYEALANLKYSANSNKESSIKKKLKKKYGGKTEVYTESGFIDLLTDELLIEIKSYDDWKCALGQLIAYSIDYPDKQKCMYLFDVNDRKTSHIKKICKKTILN